MKVILSAESGELGTVARDWCAAHLGPADSVVAVVGVSNVGELALSVPPFEVLTTEDELLAVVDHDFCRPLHRAGVPCTARFVRRSQAHAVESVADDVDADLIVVGKRPHGRVADAVLGQTVSHVVHRPRCPVVVVPAVA